MSRIKKTGINWPVILEMESCSLYIKIRKYQLISTIYHVLKKAIVRIQDCENCVLKNPEIIFILSFAGWCFVTHASMILLLSRFTFACSRAGIMQLHYLFSLVSTYFIWKKRIRWAKMLQNALLPVWCVARSWQLFRLFSCAGIAVKHPAATDAIQLTQSIE